MNEKLKSCPFCGKDIAEITDCKGLEECTNYEKCTGSDFVAVVCNVHKGGCGATGGFAYSVDGAIELWNKRFADSDKTRWIPVWERLPKKVTNVYQVTINRKNDNYKWVQSMLWEYNTWKWWEEDEDNLDEEQYEVLAWRPLPEPYEEA